jgi:ketosteroid isomerase-like protein
MRKSSLLAVFSLIALCLPTLAQSPKEAKASGAPDAALMQKVLEGWSTMDPADAAKYYVHGPGTFFDVTPLKYNSWDEYESGVRKLLANYQSFKLTANDDATVHVHGDLAWGTATVKEDAVLKSGKHELATLRWTAIWEKRNGEWLIVHDHTSEPLQ